MPESLLKRLAEGAGAYGLHVSTYTKLILEMGFLLQEQEGLLVIGDQSDVAAAMAYNRKAVTAAMRKARKAPRKEPVEVEVEEEIEEVKFEEPEEAAIEAGSMVKAEPSVTRVPFELDDVDFLKDAGVVVDPSV
jgi:hypothetical protein